MGNISETLQDRHIVVTYHNKKWIKNLRHMWLEGAVRSFGDNQVTKNRNRKIICVTPLNEILSPSVKGREL